MDKEVFFSVATKVSKGVPEMDKLYDHIYNEGKEAIDKIPNYRVNFLVRRLVHTAACLIKVRMVPEEVLDPQKNFWSSRRGLVVRERANEYIKRRGL